MKKLCSLVLTAALVVSLVACSQSAGGDTSSGSAGASSGTEASGTEVSGGEEGGETAEGESGVLYVPVSGDFAEYTDRVQYVWKNSGGMILPNLFRPLVLADSNLKAAYPDLASDWEVSDDGLTYTFTLKEGLKWSDGEDITVDDVVFSFTKVFEVVGANALFTTAFGYIEGAQDYRDGNADAISGIVTDGNTVTITLSSAYGDFINVVAQFYIMPEHAMANVNVESFGADDFWLDPVTSGRYIVTEINADNYYVMEPNPNYEGEKPQIQKIVVEFVADKVIAAREGIGDYMNTNVMSEIEQLSSMDTMVEYPINIMFYRYFVCNIQGTDGNTNPAMQDARVRRAILMAIDRAALAEGIFPGLANVIYSGDNTNTMGEQIAYDPEEAKQLLEEAGWDPDYELRMMIYYSDQATYDFMDSLVYYLGEIGMKATYFYTENATQDMYQTRQYDIAYKGLSAFSLNEWYAEYSSQSANFSLIFGGDTAFDALIAELAAENDPAEIARVQEQLVTLEQEKLYKLPFFSMNNTVFVSNRVHLPAGTQFANPWWNYDLNFAAWTVD